MAPHNPYVQQLDVLDRSSPRFLDQLTTLLGGKECRNHIIGLSNQDAVWLVEYLEDILSTIAPTSSASLECLRVLRWISGTRGVLPESYTLSNTRLIADSHPVASGAVADTYEGTFDGRKVCIKRVRVYSNGDPRGIQGFLQEVVMWKHMKHMNIVPFWGATTAPLQFVSEWMSNGNITEYIKKHPGADRLRLLHDVTKGLKYLHSRHVVHGDLKGPSILVDDTGRACITDFGLATITPDLEPGVQIRKSYSIRWTAPEVLGGGGGTSKEADIYSLGMVVIEVSSGAAPFANSIPASVMAKVLSGERPERPKHSILTDGLWNLTQRCLDQNPQRRPEITEVACGLQGIPVVWRDGMIPGSIRQREPLHRVPSPVAPFEVTPTRLKGPDSSMLLGRLWRRCKPNESSHQSRRSIRRIRQSEEPDISTLQATTSNTMTFKQFRQLCDLYVFSSVGDTERTKALLGAFNKVIRVATYSVTILGRLQRLCSRKGFLPTSHAIPGRLIRTIEHPVATGEYADVWEGIYNGKRVAIKALRVYKGSDVRNVKRVFCKEVVMRSRISHPNIVPFLGISGAPAPISIVSEWMPNGNVRDYVRKNPQTSRLQLLLDISRGLSFLHSLEIVHGDLKGENILVDKLGCARLDDFGFTSIAGLNCTETPASVFKGSHRWMAPELFKIDNEEKYGPPTRESDVFAFGMVTFEVFTGQVPFVECNASSIAMRRIIDGERPPRPPKGGKLGLSDELWEIIRSSLTHEEERPSVSTFVDHLEKATPDIAMLKGLANFDANSEDDVQELRHIFEYGDNTLLGMRGNETLVVIEVLDQVLSSPLDDLKLRSRCLHGLQKIAARCGLLPKSYWVAHSGLAESGDAFTTTGKVSSTRQRLIDGKMVAVKTINPDRIENFNAFKHRLCTNAVIWKRLRHRNVLSFLGFGSDSPPFSLVHPWMSNGSLPEYLRGNPDVDKLHLLLDVAHGLTYLHQYGLVHGKLTGHNILVDSDGIACISDYGLETVLSSEASSQSIQTNVRWMAPEVLGAENRRVPSGDDGKAADVYSFAMIMFEVLSGTTPFPNESDEEIVNKIATGLRPEWSSNSPSQKFADELIKACWYQEPKERPTAFEVLQSLLALGECGHQKPVVPVEKAEDDVAMGEWEQVGSTPELKHKEYSILFDSALVGSPINRLFASPNHSGSSASKDDPPNGRRKKAKKHMRHLLRLSKHMPGEAVTKPAPGAEIIDQREEDVCVSDGNVSYLVSRPIPEGKALKKVVITTVSKDQGWSSYPEHHGTYNGSWSWFELSVGSSSRNSGQKWRGEVVRNLHAHGDFKRHTIEITDGELYEKAKSGDVLTVWALARFPGWKNTVKEVKIRYVVE